jgi:hypothetical protein
MKNFKQYLREYQQGQGFLFPDVGNDIEEARKKAILEKLRTIVAASIKDPNSHLHAAIHSMTHDDLMSILTPQTPNQPTPSTPPIATVSTNNPTQMRIVNPHEVAYNPLANPLHDPSRYRTTSRDDD